MMLFSAVEFNYYGIVVAAAIAIPCALAFFVGLKSKQLNKDLAFDLVLATIIPAIFGARIYYVLFTNIRYENSITGWDFFNLSLGSFSFYGALIFGLLGILVLRLIVRRKKANYPTLSQILDFVAPFLVLGQSICAFFSFINNMSYGQLLSGDKYYIIGYYVQNGVQGSGYYQSTFLFEGLFCLLVFAVLMYIYINSKFLFYNGFVATLYAIFYGAGRIFIESLKSDALYLVPPTDGEGFKASMLFSIILLLVGVIALSLYLLRATRAGKRLLIFAPANKFKPNKFYGRVTLLESFSEKPKRTTPTAKSEKRTEKEEDFSDGFED